MTVLATSFSSRAVYRGGGPMRLIFTKIDFDWDMDQRGACIEVQGLSHSHGLLAYVTGGPKGLTYELVESQKRSALT